MIIPDINLLLYAYDSRSPSHPKAAAWLKDQLSGVDPVGFPEVVIFGFMRIATNPRVFKNPMTSAEAAGHVRSWLGQPCVQILRTSETHVEHVLATLEELGTGGNLTTDAQIAALAVEKSAILHTADSDFLRFPGLRWLNPLTGQSSAGLK